MRIPRNVSGIKLASLLKKYGYVVVRQTGSHLRLTTSIHGEHHITIPKHNELRVGTLKSILDDVADHLGLSGDTLIAELFKK